MLFILLAGNRARSRRRRTLRPHGEAGAAFPRNACPRWSFMA